MKILQAIALSSFLLLSMSKVCSQEDKKTKDFFNSGGYISERYALNRNQVRFNQSSDFVFHHIPNGNLICITSKQFRAHAFSRHYNCILSKDGYAGHSHKYRKAGGSGYLFRAATVQDFSAVTGACLLVKTSVWDEVGGLDEAFAVAFNDVDFCLRVRDAGYRIAWTPYAQLTHYESKSRGGDEKDPVKARRFAAEQQRLYAVHGKANILHDPYYNPNLTMDREDFSESNDLRGLKEGRITVQWRK